jgi:hypothetical protein
MTTNDDFSDDEINLRTDPEGQYADWNIKFADKASTKCVKIYGEGGLLNVGIGMTTVAWVAEQGAVPRPAAMVKPILVGANPVAPTVLERDLHKSALEEFHDYTEGTIDLKKELLKDLSPALLTATKDVATGHRNRSITWLLDFLHVRYGAMSEINLKKIKALLAAIWTSEQNLEAHCELYKNYHAKLVLLGQPRSESDKFELFDLITATLPNVTYYLKMYYEDNLNINARTLTAAMAFLVSQEPNFTTKSAGWVGGVAASDAEFERRVANGIKEGIAKHAKRVAAAAGGGAPGGAPAAPAAGHHAEAPSWCFKHGPGHGGRKCKYMLARPAFFTKEFLEATHQCNIRGTKSYPEWVEA